MRAVRPMEMFVTTDTVHRIPPQPGEEMPGIHPETSLSGDAQPDSGCTA